MIKLFAYPGIVFLIGLVGSFLSINLWGGNGQNGAVMIFLSILLFIVILVNNVNHFGRSYSEDYEISEDSFSFKPTNYCEVTVEYANIKSIELFPNIPNNSVFPFFKNVEGIYYPSRFYENFFKVIFINPVDGVNPLRDKKVIVNYRSFILGDDQMHSLQKIIRNKIERDD